MTRKLEIPMIEPHERTALVDQLVEIINEQKKLLDDLREEVARLKGHKGKPKIRPSVLEKNKNKKSSKQRSEKNSASSKSEPTRTEIIKE